MKRWMISAAVLAATAGAAFGQAQDNPGNAEQFRRIVIDVSGMPPSPQQIEAFVGDDRLEARRQWLDGVIVAQVQEVPPANPGERFVLPVPPTAADVRAAWRA